MRRDKWFDDDNKEEIELNNKEEGEQLEYKEEYDGLATEVRQIIDGIEEAWIVPFVKETLKLVNDGLDITPRT